MVAVARTYRRSTLNILACAYRTILGEGAERIGVGNRVAGCRSFLASPVALSRLKMVLEGGGCLLGGELGIGLAMEKLVKVELVSN